MTASAYSTLGLEFLVEAEVSKDLVRLMVVGATGRRLLFMWDMTREQAATLTAVIDGRLRDYLDAADVPAAKCEECVSGLPHHHTGHGYPHEAGPERCWCLDDVPAASTGENEQ